MCRYVLLALGAILLALMVAAALVVQEYGWQGFLVMIAGFVVVGYIARKAMRPLFMYMITRPLRNMGAALRGARILVHSIAPCEPPSPEDYDPGVDADDCGYDGEQAIEDWRNDEEPDADDDGFRSDRWVPPRLDWYHVEFTVIPPDAGSSEGRIVHRRAWNPQLIGAVGPRPELERSNPFHGWPPMNQFTEFVHNTGADVWDGTEFAASEREIFGEQRLRMRIGVGREIQTVTITYAHYTDIGEVRIPRIDVSPEPTS
jgi:hypothetical protein